MTYAEETEWWKRHSDSCETSKCDMDIAGEKRNATEIIQSNDSRLMGAHLHIHRTVLFVYFVYIDVYICGKGFSHDIDVSNDIIYHIMLALAFETPAVYCPSQPNHVQKE